MEDQLSAPLTLLTIILDKLITEALIVKITK